MCRGSGRRWVKGGRRVRAVRLVGSDGEGRRSRLRRSPVEWSVVGSRRGLCRGEQVVTARGGKRVHFPPAVLGLLQSLYMRGEVIRKQGRKRTVARVENVGSGPSSSTVAYGGMGGRMGGRRRGIGLTSRLGKASRLEGRQGYGGRRWNGRSGSRRGFAGGKS